MRITEKRVIQLIRKFIDDNQIKDLESGFQNDDIYLKSIQLIREVIDLLLK